MTFQVSGAYSRLSTLVLAILKPIGERSSSPMKTPRRQTSRAPMLANLKALFNRLFLRV